MPSRAMATYVERELPISATIQLRKRKQTLKSLESAVSEKKNLYDGIIDRSSTVLLLLDWFINVNFFSFKDIKRLNLT